MRALWSPALVALAALAATAHAQAPLSPPPPAPTSPPPFAPPGETPPGAPGQAAPGPTGSAVAPPQQQPAPARPPERSSVSFALGVSSPFAWWAGSYGASAYVGVGLRGHHAVRLNASRSKNPSPLLDLPANVTPEAEDGRVINVGLGWVWYPRRRWDGPMIEAGAYREDRDTTSWSDFGPTIGTETTAYAGRVMVGWSLRFARYLFVAVAVGGSLAYQSGHETVTPNESEDPGGMVVTNRIARSIGSPEGYLRLGLAFGR